jgi:hypothetical protein
MRRSAARGDMVYQQQQKKSHGPETLEKKPERQIRR